MPRIAWLLAGIAGIATIVGAEDIAQRLNGDDIAVLEGVIRDDCADPKREPIMVADEPESPYPKTLTDERLERAYGATLRSRSSERTRWPIQALCKTVRVESSARIRNFFAKDKRIPAGWEGFEAEFGAKTYLTISRPAYSVDRRRALVSLGSHCGELCGSGHLIELEKTSTGWHAVRVVSTWIS